MDIRMDMQQLEQRMQKIERAMRAAANAKRQAFLRVETVLGGVGRVEQAVMNLLVIARTLSQAHPSHANEDTHVPPSSAPLRRKTPPPTPPDSKEKVFIFLYFCTPVYFGIRQMRLLLAHHQTRLLLAQ